MHVYVSTYLYPCIHVSVYVRMYVCMYVCMYVYIYMYVCICIYAHRYSGVLARRTRVIDTAALVSGRFLDD